MIPSRFQPPPGRPPRWSVAAVTLTLLTTACGAEVVEDEKENARTVTVQRCGERVEYTEPERAVVYEGGSADKMFVLGLTDHVHGYVMPPANPPVEESPWASEYEKTRLLSKDLLNRELVVDAKADFVLAGWQSGFAPDRGITPEILDELGISSFVHAESCYNYPGHPERVTPFEGLYTDLERLGKIFGVQQRADRVIDDFRQRVRAVREQAPKGERVPVFVYDSGTDKAFTAGSQVPPNDIIRYAGGRNIFADLRQRWTEVGWEAVVEEQPEVIIVLDYQDQPAKEKIEYLRTAPHTRNLPAVKQRNFYVLDYNEAISGPRNIDGLEGFAAYLRELEQRRH